jgi:hypothetical protein
MADVAHKLLVVACCAALMGDSYHGVRDPCDMVVEDAGGMYHDIHAANVVMVVLAGGCGDDNRVV